MSRNNYFSLKYTLSLPHECFSNNKVDLKLKSCFCEKSCFNMRLNIGMSIWKIHICFCYRKKNNGKKAFKVCQSRRKSVISLQQYIRYNLFRNLFTKSRASRLSIHRLFATFENLNCLQRTGLAEQSKRAPMSC